MNAPALALVLYVSYLVLTFGLRAWLLYRRTGSTGFNGFTERRGSAGWWGGVLFAVAVLTGLAAPILQLLGVVQPIRVLALTPVFVLGIVLAFIGVGLTLGAQQAMGKSWRVGVDHDEITDLVRTGMFAAVRNPIFSAVALTAMGLALIAPNVVAIAAAVVLIVAVQLQVRAVEEPYLIAAHGDAYLDYASTTGRFIPGLGKIVRAKDARTGFLTQD